MVDVSGPLRTLDRSFEEVALETRELTWGLEGTTTREKLLQVTAHDICRCNDGLALQMHIAAGAAYGISYADLQALTRFVAPYAGYPAAATATRAVRTYAQELGLITEPEANHPRVDAAIHAPVWKIDDPWLRDFVVSRFDRAWAESALSPRERVFVALTALLTLGETGPAWQAHLDLAVEIAGAEDVRSAIRFTAEMGLTALTCQNVVLL